MADFIYKNIKNYIISLIEENRGDTEYMLPSENQLAIKFNASRISVRKALSELEAENKITRMKGRGTFLKNHGEAGKSGLFAAILPAPSTVFMSEIIRGVTDYCNDNNRGLLMFFSLNSAELEAKHIKTALSLNVMGILLMPLDTPYYSEAILNLAVKKIPMVFIDRKYEGLNVPMISSDHYRMVFDSVKYLCESGRKDVLYVSPQGRPSSIYDRIAGYEDALKQSYGIIKKYVFAPDLSAADADEQFLAYLENNKITAAVSASGLTAVKLVSAMSRLNKAIFKDYDIVLLDEESQDMETFTGRAIPTVVQDGRNIGMKAAETLDNIINRRAFPAGTFIPHRFVR